MRKRTVARGFIESIIVPNHSSTPIEIEMRIQGDADFADLFEVKDALLHKKGHSYRRIEPDHLVLGYRREEYVRETWIVAPDASVDEGGVTYRLRLQPHGEWSTRLEVRVVSSSEAVRRGATNSQATREERQKRVAHALAEAPRVLTDWPDLLRRTSAASSTLRRSAIPDCWRPASFPPRFAVVHGGLRTRQSHHQSAGTAVRAVAGGDHASRARGAAGHPRRRVP